MEEIPFGYVRSPIYLEDYAHEGCKCYKIDNPWSKYKKHKIVLCKESDGIVVARDIAKKEINRYFEAALLTPIE